MIFHLSTIGVPIIWSVTAVYRDSYGIAHNAAARWAEEHRSCHFVCKVEVVDDKLKVTREHLWLEDGLLNRQKPMRSKDHLVQFGLFPLPVPSGYADVVAEALLQAMANAGYFIPRDEWERLYPEEVISGQRWSDFFEAQDRLGPEMPFELRWAGFMDPPPDFVFPFSLAGEGDARQVVETLPDGSSQVVKPIRGDLEKVCRLLNSGYTAAQIDILLAKDQVQPATEEVKS